MYKAIMRRKNGLEVWEVFKDNQLITTFMSEWKATQVAEEFNYKETKRLRVNQRQLTIDHIKTCLCKNRVSFLDFELYVNILNCKIEILLDICNITKTDLYSNRSNDVYFDMKCSDRIKSVIVGIIAAHEEEILAGNFNIEAVYG